MPKHYTTPPTMETQTIGREKRAYLDNADELKKKKKKTPRDAPHNERSCDATEEQRHRGLPRTLRC